MVAYGRCRPPPSRKAIFSIQNSQDPPKHPFCVPLHFINMTDGGHYLGNESLAAPPGVVETLDEESQELPPDQLPSAEDRRAPPSDPGVPL